MKKLALLMLFFLFFCSEKSTSQEVKKEEPIKDFTYQKIQLKDWDGKLRKIEDFKGEVFVIDVWASWCVPCKYSTPVFEELKERFDSKNVTFYGLNSDTEISIEKIKKAAKNFGMTYPSLLDPEFKLINALEVRGQPAVFIFDKNSEKKYLQYGINEADLDELSDQINSLL